jgi:predicted amidohydrolase YtcJ
MHLFSMVAPFEVDADGGTICDTPEWLAHKMLTVDQVLPMMTIEPAYALFRDQEVGSLRPGKLADLIILSGNPLTVGPAAIKDIQVRMTMVGGRVAYCAPGYEPLCPLS